jgi:hypothetical protein
MGAEEPRGTSDLDENAQVHPNTANRTGPTKISSEDIDESERV